MGIDEKLLSYCGIYCGDCLGYTGIIAEAAKQLQDTRKEYRFDQSAKHVFAKELKDYSRFEEMLGFMTELRCNRTYSSFDGGESKCEIHQCNLEHGYGGCYECDDYIECDKLRNTLGGLYYEACLKNLKEIKKMGLQQWLAEGKSNHYWDI